jgi:ribosomal protein S18 acetylase RimI-like enzyme
MSEQTEEAAAIRAYDAGRDAAAVRACFLELQEFERALEPTLPAGAAVADAYLRRMFDRCAQWDGAVFVAVVAGEEVGFVSVWARVPQEELDEAPGEYAAISDLVVHPEFRRRGLGRMLLAEAERYARTHGAATLKIGVLARNAAARRLYEALDFVDYRVQLAKRLR